MTLINLLFQGLLLGGYYALLASGLSFMFGVMRIINLAHGSLAVLAAFLLFICADRFGLNPFIAIGPVLIVMALLGWLLYVTVFERSQNGGALLPILSTFGLATVIDNLLFQVFGADTRSLGPYIDNLAYDSWTLPGDLYVGQLAVLVFALAVAVLAGLQLVLKFTAIGRQIRAAAEDADAAQLAGVNSPRVYAFASAISLVLVGLAGLSLSLRSTFDPYSGSQQLVFAFEAVIIGGAGSLWGTLWGGVILGVAQSFGAGVNPQGFLIAGHVVFLLILVFRLYAAGKISVLRRRLMWSRA